MADGVDDLRASRDGCAKGRGRGALAVAAVVGAAVGAGAVGTVWALAGTGAGDEQPPGKFSMSGSVVLPARGSIEAGESGCTGYEGSAYRDVAEGAPVVVFGSGVQVGESTLGLGQPQDVGNQSITCTFPVVIPDVAPVDGSYLVRVAGLEPVKVTATEARAGFTLTFE
ncbi:hypothetical protein AB0M23_28460 [Streptomyces sp. NPDC052077]|uniref:hypothetical protein n=1 Tax=Streptomyces sp. NPDC052077 TaxID=3154757 RepID=UPI00343BEC1E